jgi:hypothetical protein
VSDTTTSQTTPAPAAPITALAPLPIPSTGLAAVSGGSVMADLFFNEDKFKMLGRAAKMFALSPLVPQHLKGNSLDEGIANCAILLALAIETGENPLILMQSAYFVSGKPGWNATYIIAKGNASGRFRDPLDWDVSGSGNALSVRCHATLARTGKEVSATVDMAMAEAEGWTKNSKYRSMPEQMLRYRSATFLMRLYAPEILLGMRTTDELEDVHAGGESGGTGAMVTVSVAPGADSQAAAAAAATKPAPGGVVDVRNLQPRKPPAPAWIAEYESAYRAYGAAHQGVIPEWLAGDVLDEATARQLMARMGAGAEGAAGAAEQGSLV